MFYKLCGDENRFANYVTEMKIDLQIIWKWYGNENIFANYMERKVFETA